MKDLNNYCLVNHNTFKIIANAKRFISFDNTDEFISFSKSNKELFKEKFLVIGEGSNILYTCDFDGTVIHPETKKLSVISEDKDFVLIKADAGIVWDDFVAETMKLKAFGLENLSLIPGTIGASVVQNIGAYGAEAGDFVDSVEYLCLEDFIVKTIDKKQCKFAYRNSIFKNELKNKIIVLSVTYKLSKKTVCNTEYADIQKYCGQEDELTHEKIRSAVIEIRNNKLPDPDIIGNAGSFFKNPIIDGEKFKKMISDFPDLRFYSLKNGEYKLAAGWLIDQCKLKGFEHKGAAVHKNQALVLVNKSGKADGLAVKELSEIVRETVNAKYGVLLEPEVIIL